MFDSFTYQTKLLWCAFKFNKKSGIEQVDKINKFKDQFNIDDDSSLDKLSMKDDDFKYLFKGNTNDFSFRL